MLKMKTQTFLIDPGSCALLTHYTAGGQANHIATVSICGC